MTEPLSEQALDEIERHIDEYRRFAECEIPPHYRVEVAESDLRALIAEVRFLRKLVHDYKRIAFPNGYPPEARLTADQSQKRSKPP